MTTPPHHPHPRKDPKKDENVVLGMPLLRTIGGLIVVIVCGLIAWDNRAAGVGVWGVAVGLALVGATIIDPATLASFLPFRRNGSGK